MAVISLQGAMIHLTGNSQKAEPCEIDTSFSKPRFVNSFSDEIMMNNQYPTFSMDVICNTDLTQPCQAGLSRNVTLKSLK